MLRHRTRRSTCWRPPSLPRSTSFSARGWSACARRSRSPAPAAATLRRSCSMPPGASNRSTPRWLARRISRRWRRRCSPVASATIQASARLPRPLGLRRRHRSRHARSTCSSTAWRRDSPRATRPAYRRSEGRSTRSATWRDRPQATCAGCGWRVAWPRISGTTSSGTCSRPAGCASRERRARSACSRSRPRIARPSTFMREPSAPLRR